MIHLLKHAVPRAVRRPVRHALDVAAARLRRLSSDLHNDAHDAWDRLRGRAGPLTPPRKLVAGIGGDLEVGERFVGYFRELAKLGPDEAVLDVGCGVGRMALPLTRYLTPRGRYEGFDIVRANVAWCDRAITPRFPNFHFRHADIFNREYNPRGPVEGHEYRFPYADGSFDFVFLTSVFTHLMPPTVAHYLAEIGRVLRPGGRCAATFFLLTDESNRLVDAGRSRFTLHPAEGVYRVHSREVPETCIALDERFVEDAVRAVGMTLQRPVHYGVWCGREAGLDFQDLAILRKPSP